MTSLQQLLSAGLPSRHESAWPQSQSQGVLPYCACKPSRLRVAHSRSDHWQVQAERPRRGDWRDEDYVELDDEEDWDEQDGKPGTSIQSILGNLLPGALMVSERISDALYHFFPEGTSRTAVDTIVKAGLALLVLGIARSLLGFITTVGGIVLAFFIIRNFLGKDGGDTSRTKTVRKTSTGSQRPEKGAPKGFLGSGRAGTSRDWSDVWLDSKAARQRQDQPRR